MPGQSGDFLRSLFLRRQEEMLWALSVGALSLQKQADTFWLKSAQKTPDIWNNNTQKPWKLVEKS